MNSRVARWLAGRPLLKVCGAVSAADVAVMAAGTGRLVGLWWGIPGGPAELGRPAVAAMAAAVRAAGLTPVLVTFSADVEALVEVVTTAGIEWVQLHAFQLPPVVAALRERLGDGVVLMKVLHINRDRCVERRFVPAYERAGVDLFLVDAVLDHQVGSTGTRLDEQVVLDLVGLFSLPFLLAGGITGRDGPMQRVLAHPAYRGVDIDTGARDGGGRFDAGLISAVAAVWTAPTPGAPHSFRDTHPDGDRSRT